MWYVRSWPWSAQKGGEMNAIGEETTFCSSICYWVSCDFGIKNQDTMLSGKRTRYLTYNTYIGIYLYVPICTGTYRRGSPTNCTLVWTSVRFLLFWCTGTYLMIPLRLHTRYGEFPNLHSRVHTWYGDSFDPCSIMIPIPSSGMEQYGEVWSSMWRCRSISKLRGWVIGSNN